MNYYIKIALQHLAMGLIIPVSVVWKLQNGLSLPEAIFTESIVLLSTALADLPAGLIANRLNNKRSLLIGGLLHIVGMGFLAIGSSLVIFIIAAVATGIAWAFISGADEAYIYDDFIEDKKNYRKIFATSTIVDESATIVGMLGTSALLYFHAPMRTLFIIAACILAVHFVYTYIFLPQSKQLPPAQAKLSGKKFKNARRGEILAALPLLLGFAIIYEVGRPLWQPHMQQIGIDVANFGLIFIVLKIASLSGSAIARYHAFHLKNLLVMFTLMLISLLTFGVSVQAVSLVALGVFLFTENYFRVYQSTAINKLITTNRAAMLSIGSTVRSGAGALILLGAGAAANVSLLVALCFIVVIKIPAMGYIIARQRRAEAT